MILDDVADWLAGERAGRWLRQLVQGLRFWGPVIALPEVVLPVTIVSAALSLVLLSGIAIAALGVFLTAVLALSLLLSEVFGVTIEFGVA
jgi:hypothetical protein